MGRQTLFDRGSAWLSALIVAPFIGSFLGVLIRRLPARRRLAIVRSACEGCGRRLTPRELIPVVSFALQRGRCIGCGSNIAPMHLWVELAALAVAAVASVMLADPMALWLGCGLGWTLLVLAWIDVEHMPVPDVLTLPLIAAGFAATWRLEPDASVRHAVSAAIGYVTQRVLAASGRAVGRRDNRDHGEAMVLAAGGAWTGLFGLPLVLLGAAAGTLCWTAAVRLRGKSVSTPALLPMIPGIALAAWVVWLWEMVTLCERVVDGGIGCRA